MTQIEIAHELQVSEASISSDMQYLRNQAKETISEYVTECLPIQYQVCLCIASFLNYSMHISVVCARGTS